MNTYELVTMFPVDMNDVSAEKRINDKCKKYHIEVVALNKWGVKSLAYPIKKQNKAYFLQYDIQGESQDIKAFDKDLQLDETLVRYLIVKVKKTATKEEKKTEKKK